MAPVHREVSISKMNSCKLKRKNIFAASRLLRPDCAVGDDHFEAVVLRCGEVGTVDEQRRVFAVGTQEGGLVDENAHQWVNAGRRHR